MSVQAIHAIWTTYATWLPGDPRGHWSPLFDFYGRLIEQGHTLNLPDATSFQYAKANAKEPERVLAPLDQEIVADTIGEVLRVDLSGRIPAFGGAVERTHVHLLLGTIEEEISSVIGRIKGRTSSAVVARGTERWRTRTWTSGFWKVFVFDVRAIPEIQAYIERHNERRGLNPAPYSWIAPFV